jgi:hypothetical protein
MNGYKNLSSCYEKKNPEINTPTPKANFKQTITNKTIPKTNKHQPTKQTTKNLTNSSIFPI